MSSSIHPSRAPNIPEPQDARRKKHKKKTFKPQPASSSLSRSQLRKKIRDTTRLLAASSTTSSLSATTRSDHERALAAYQHELAGQQLADRRSALAKRYHKVRFFERRKADRALARLRRQLAALSSSPSNHKSVDTALPPSSPSSSSDGDGDGDGNDRKTPLETEESLRCRIRDAELDLAYITHFPPLEKYISLYRPSDTPATNDKRARIRADISRRIADGSLREAPDAPPVTDHRAKHSDRDKRTSTTTKHKPKQTAPAEEDEEEEDDGGFFEV
ncbi:hypothetical protein DRE_01418 [Drechslerella stenobrocha 248]|uniref:rRNA-processing protein EFG1 n=1 Tax=Drechslerella stenobrocha 248 TaxID=1043628 RepID=W7HJG2_9PEZI|nr:hypothetical protein DRE_01418 [Drechslerella stenobrocha 248]